jgi:hypothetical protein
MRLNQKAWGLRILFVLLIVLIAVSMVPGELEAADYPDDVVKAKQSIKGKKLVSHIGFLASKYCRGRDPGDAGMELADLYITTALSGSGITPAGESGYYQEVHLKHLSLDKNIRLKIDRSARGMSNDRSARLDWDFLPVILSAERTVSAPVVFAGYGITAPEHKYDDYNNLDAAGKIVLVLRHEPGEKDADSPFDGEKNSKHGTLLAKILNAQEHGAVGILFVTDPLNHDDLSVKGGSYMSGTYWPSLRKEAMKDNEDFKYMSFNPRVRMTDVDYGVKIPAVTISGELAADILGAKHSLKDIQGRIDKNKRPNSFQIPGKRVAMDIFFRSEPLPAHNILFKVEGSDPELKKEVVMVGAHYDHVGKDNRGQVFGGADDNASGTSVLMELAMAFKRLGKAPKRTILFILFTAEEKGLMGSRHYAEHPIFPLDKTIALFNLDMVGRNDVDQLTIVGKYQYR